MATITKAQLATLVLKHIGIVASDGSPTASDQADTEQVIDAVHAELRKEGLVPFATSAIEEWAQIPLRDYVALEVGPAFGRMAMTQAQKDSEQRKLRSRLARQVGGARRMPVRMQSY